MALPCRRLSTIPLLRLPPRSIFTIRHTRLRSSPLTTYSKPFPNQSIRWPWLNHNYAICVGSASLAFALYLGLSPPLTLGTGMTDPGKTTEQLMLEEFERKHMALCRASLDQPLILRILKRARLFIIECVIEPIATGLHFVHLVVIFVPLILAIPLVFVGPRQPDRSNERTGTIWWYAFLIKSMERAGPTFIKLGQWAASRTDIFPAEMCEMMSKLHSDARAHSLRDTKQIISQAFGGRPFDEIFEEFDEKPLGIGAVAQVYRAKLSPHLLPRLHEEDETNFKKNLRRKVDVLVKKVPQQGVPSSYVAIKVLHPRVDRIVHRDLRIMGFFASLLNLVPTLEWLSFPDEVDKFSEMMRLQMDLRIEANNLSRFRSNFGDRTTVTFPMPYSNYTTREILIEEFAHGIPLSAFLESGAGPFRKEMADMGLDAFLHMLIMDNFIHADLHPGNIMVRFYKPEPLPSFSPLPLVVPGRKAKAKGANNHKEVTEEVISRLMPLRGNSQEWQKELSLLDNEGYRPQLIFIDTGLVTELNSVNRRNFLDLFRTIAEFDGYRVGHLMIERCRSPSAVIDNEIFALKMQHLILAVKSRTLALGNIKIGDLLTQVLQMVRVHHVRMEGDFINVVLSILLLEGIGRNLDPNLDLLQSSLPMLRSIGAGSGAQMLGKGGKGDFGLLKVWIALEARQFINSSVEDVENLVKYDLLSPNV
ncbi:ABC1-domain-containing protein [Choiromyces venosus 120613-1]|uniref:ABC1-domain-containing protein n=1 Tax=Choiromyces venosus 120613-1 TaxID=1336337 RepID=A0A3N4JJ39_9PEZI|nr:ABC1-domain-containing protein [Choiromyces venosus 120613-1]